MLPGIGYVSGNWYTTPAGPSLGGSDAALQTDHLYLLPFYVGPAYSFSAIGFSVGTAPTASIPVQLGIYENNSGAPGSLLLDAGTASVTAVGINSLPLPAGTLLSGWYFLAMGIGSTSPSVLVFSTYNDDPFSGILGNKNFYGTSQSTKINGFELLTYSGGALPASASSAEPAYWNGAFPFIGLLG
jgi:hypothetical protein